jgi:hypothetical protein
MARDGICDRGPFSLWLCLDLYADFLFEVGLARRGALLRRFVLVGHAVQFNDAPAFVLHLIERREHGRQIDSSLAQFHKLEGILCSRRTHRDIDDVLQVHEQQVVVVLENRLGGIASARDIVGGVEFEVHVLRIGGIENALEVVGCSLMVFMWLW